MRRNIEIFAGKMEKKLATKDEQLGEEGWLETCDVDHLVKCIEIDLEKLKKAQRDCDAKKAEKESVNIGNYAMMISDRVRGRYHS